MSDYAMMAIAVALLWCACTGAHLLAHRFGLVPSKTVENIMSDSIWRAFVFAVIYAISCISAM